MWWVCICDWYSKPTNDTHRKQSQRTKTGRKQQQRWPSNVWGHFIHVDCKIIMRKPINCSTVWEAVKISRWRFKAQSQPFVFCPFWRSFVALWHFSVNILLLNGASAKISAYPSQKVHNSCKFFLFKKHCFCGLFMHFSCTENVFKQKRIWLALVESG